MKQYQGKSEIVRAFLWNDDWTEVPQELKDKGNCAQDRMGYFLITTDKTVLRIAKGQWVVFTPGGMIFDVSNEAFQACFHDVVGLSHSTTGI